MKSSKPVFVDIVGKMFARAAILIALLGQSLGGAWLRCVCTPADAPRSANCCVAAPATAADCCGTAAACSCCEGCGSEKSQQPPASVAVTSSASSSDVTCCAPKTECADCRCDSSSSPAPFPVPLPHSITAVDLVLLAPAIDLLLPEPPALLPPHDADTTLRFANSHQRRQATLAVWLN